jgi:hypothetical protein
MHTQEFVLFILSELVFVSRKNYPGKKISQKTLRGQSHIYPKFLLLFFCYFWLIGSFFILKQTDYRMTLVFFEILGKIDLLLLCNYFLIEKLLIFFQQLKLQSQ